MKFHFSVIHVYNNDDLFSVWLFLSLDIQLADRAGVSLDAKIHLLGEMNKMILCAIQADNSNYEFRMVSQVCARTFVGRLICQRTHSTRFALKL